MNGLLTATKPKRPQLYRQELTPLIKTTDTLLLPDNPRRYALIIGTPIGGASGGGTSITSASVNVHAFDTSTAGVKLSYTCPANTSAFIQTANWRELTGAGAILSYMYTPNLGTKEFVGSNLVSGAITIINQWIAAGDNVDLEIPTGGTAVGTADAQISIAQYAAGGAGGADNTVWMSLLGPAVVNLGMPLHPGASPLVLMYDHFGQALREEIRAIASSSPVNIAVWDIFEVDCTCGVSSSMG